MRAADAWATPSRRSVKRGTPASQAWSGVESNDSPAVQHPCDIFYTSCLPNVQTAPTIHSLMIISTLRVGPWGPLFLFCAISEQS